MRFERVCNLRFSILDPRSSPIPPYSHTSQHPDAVFVVYNADTLKLNSPKDITVVGSAKIGFSLSPHNFPRHFSDESDIDVVVVDEALFDKYWMIMVEWNYPRRTIRLAQGDLKWIRKRKNELFWGWFLPDRIQYKGLYRPHILKPLLDISNRWFDAFQSLALYPEFAERKVSGRLYRTFEHARL